MGYYTDFSIDKNTPEIVEEIQQVSGYDWYGSYYLNAKWYSCEIDVKQVSSKYPDQLITISGVGEERDDIWVRYFLNGKMQEAKAEITFEEFDENKLE